MKIRDLKGMVFGILTVKEIHSQDKYNRCVWLCDCECGQSTIVQSTNLVNGTTKSCGCLKHRPAANFKDLRGMKFNRLVARTLIRRDKKSYYECECDCGNKRVVWSAHLRNGHTRSCGCYKFERIRETNKIKMTGKRGKESRRYNHNLSDEDRFRRRMTDDKIWSKKILFNNDFTCIKCFNVGGVLHAHHLNGYSKYKDQRLDIDNGVSLCVDCHRKYHIKFGSFAKTKDFHEWIGAPYDEDLPSYKELRNNISNMFDSCVVKDALVLICKKRKDMSDKINDLEVAIKYINNYVSGLNK